MLRVTCQQEGGVVSGTAPDVVWVLVPQNGQTALHVASNAGHLEVVRFLVHECKGVDVHATNTVILRPATYCQVCCGSKLSQ